MQELIAVLNNIQSHDGIIRNRVLFLGVAHHYTRKIEK